MKLFRTRNALGKQYVVQQLQQDYRMTFGNTANGAHNVLHDLAAFCYAGRTPATADERETLINIGRNQVWLHIQNHLHLEPDQLARVLAGLPPHLTEE
jgi:hypothetical protein